jgi:dTDP-4-amino-4,6-dideoxygalactose transaminase
VQLATRVPYVDIAGAHAALRGELLAAVAAVIDSGSFILGEEVAEFERRFAALCGTRFAVGVGSGTDALVLALRALEIGPGDEVVTAPNSFVASASAIALCGARPIFADVGDDYNLDPRAVARAITPRTKALLPVHLTGNPADMTALCEVADRAGVAIVEDCAQAVTAEHRGKRVGSFGALGCFSLHPLKTLSACGDAGIVTTDDPGLAQRIRVLRNIGLRSRDDCVEWSGNSRLDTLQAAILLVKLRYLDAWTEQRRANARAYREGLRGCPHVVVPPERIGDRAVYHTFVVQAESRDALRTFLDGLGVGTQVHYPTPIHLTGAARNLGCRLGDFPVAERQAGRILSLPVHHLLGDEQIAYVCDAIRAFYAEGGAS